MLLAGARVHEHWELGLNFFTIFTKYFANNFQVADADALAGVSIAGRASNMGLDLVGRDEVGVFNSRLLRYAHHRPERNSSK